MPREEGYDARSRPGAASDQRAIAGASNLVWLWHLQSLHQRPTP